MCLDYFSNSFKLLKLPQSPSGETKKTHPKQRCFLDV